MKQLALFLLLLLGCLTVNAQTLSGNNAWTGQNTYQNTTQQNGAATVGNWVACGDSMTYGLEGVFDTGTFTNPLQQMLGVPIANVGIGGTTSTQIATKCGVASQTASGTNTQSIIEANSANIPACSTPHCSSIQVVFNLGYEPTAFSTTGGSIGNVAGTIAGIHGALAETALYQAGSAVSFVSGTSVTLNGLLQQQGVATPLSSVYAVEVYGLTGTGCSDVNGPHIVTSTTVSTLTFTDTCTNVTGNGVASVYSFTPDPYTAGATITAGTTPYVPDVICSGCSIITWPGRNNIFVNQGYPYGVPVIEGSIDAIAALVPSNRTFVVMPVIPENTPGEWSGQANYTTIQGLQSDLVTWYGPTGTKRANSYVDVWGALQAAKNPSLITDGLDVANGNIPTSLRDIVAVCALDSNINNSVTNGINLDCTNGVPAKNLVTTLDAGNGGLDENIFCTNVTPPSGGVTYYSLSGCTRNYGGLAANALTHNAGSLAYQDDMTHLNAQGDLVVAKAIAQHLGLVPELAAVQSISGTTFSGTGTLSLSGFNNGCTGSTATVTLAGGLFVGANVTAAGTGCTSAPTTATCTSGTASCTGSPITINVGTALGLAATGVTAPLNGANTLGSYGVQTQTIAGNPTAGLQIQLGNVTTTAGTVEDSVGTIYSTGGSAMAYNAVQTGGYSTDQWSQPSPSTSYLTAMTTNGWSLYHALPSTLAAVTAISGGTFSGTGTLLLTNFNNGCTGTATVTLAAGVFASAVVTAQGTDCTAAPTTATCTSGTATCTGSPVTINVTASVGPAINGPFNSFFPAYVAPTGTVATTSGSGTVTGSGTNFTTAVIVGSTVTVNGESHTVTEIDSDTSLKTANWTNTNAAGTAWTYTVTARADATISRSLVQFGTSSTKFVNNSDASNVILCEAGLTADQICAFEFYDRTGTARWDLEKLADNSFRIYDVVNTLYRMIVLPAGFTEINSGGGANPVYINVASGSGTSGLKVYNGGTTPAILGTIDSNGVNSQNGFSDTVSGTTYTGFTGTATSGTCVLTIKGGIITGTSGC